MSYILEALRKADQERSAGNVPDLEAVHDSATQRTGRSRWVWVLGVILAVNVLVLLLLLLRDGQDEPLPAVETRSVPQRQVARVAPAPPPAVVLSRPAPPAPAPAVPASRRPPVAPPVQTQEPYPDPRLATAPPVTQPSAPDLSRQVTTQTAAPAVTPPSARTVARSVRSQPSTSSATEAGVPYWDDMSLEFRSDLSMQRLDVHVYDSNPQRRFLLVELKKYREGDTLTNGAVIEEILPDGVQLFYRGTRFIYRK